MDTSCLHPKQIEAVTKLAPIVQQGAGAIVWWKMGEGKSRIALAIYSELKFTHKGICLVVCRRKAFETWREEIKKYPSLSVRVDDLPSPSEPLPFISKDRDNIWLVSHAMLHKVLNRIKNLPLQLVILDELYLYSNHKSQRSIAAMAICEFVRGRTIGLSGTILPAKDTLALWGQSRVVGLSDAIAPNTTAFYSNYKSSFLVDYGRGQVSQWTDKPKAKERILDALQDYTHIHFPKSTRQIVESFNESKLTLKQIKVINQLRDEYYVSDEEQDFTLELRSALELIIKVSQIANGWCKDAAGNLAHFPSNKLDALCASLDESHAGNIQRIVWCHFHNDIETIQNNLDFECLKMSGIHPFDVDRWKSGRFPVVLATMGSGASVNDFKGVEYASIFSSSFKHLDFTQSLARTNRYDSSHSKCLYHFFHAKGTFDRHIYDTVKKTGEVEQEFIKKGILKQWLLKPVS